MPASGTSDNADAIKTAVWPPMPVNSSTSVIGTRISRT
jgi:hypothetical protein